LIHSLDLTNVEVTAITVVLPSSQVGVGLICQGIVLVAMTVVGNMIAA
jgi:hypothetical protein